MSSRSSGHLVIDELHNDVPECYKQSLFVAFKESLLPFITGCDIECCEILVSVSRLRLRKRGDSNLGRRSGQRLFMDIGGNTRMTSDCGHSVPPKVAPRSFLAFTRLDSAAWRRYSKLTADQRAARLEHDI